MPRVIHFEIHADKPERAIAFYRGLFGWSIEKFGDQPYWLIKTGESGSPGIDGGLMPRRGPRPTDGQPMNGFPCTVDVPNLDASLEKATATGGRVVVPKMGVANVGWLAFCVDTEGNIFGMMQNDPNAH